MKIVLELERSRTSEKFVRASIKSVDGLGDGMRDQGKVQFGEALSVSEILRILKGAFRGQVLRNGQRAFVPAPTPRPT